MSNVYEPNDVMVLMVPHRKWLGFALIRDRALLLIELLAT